ncbi:group II intron reverse transcriptase/maturase [Mariniphaga anaerophila]|nr:group II intron reverse transcriptase/maturase [Mariniphaga anaerophila]
MSTVELQIAERARKFEGEALHNLHHFIDLPMLEGSYKQLNRQSAKGVDGKTWQDYGEEGFKEKLENLLKEFKSGRYRAPAIRRAYIPKDKHSKRPIGIPTIEDKILQASVRKVIEPIFEGGFKDFSYGFRPGRSPHQAIDFMFRKVSFDKMHYIIDADIKNYFGSINQGLLRDFLDKRVNDGVVRKMINRWLKAGIMESGNISYPDEGTPQGGIILPILIDIYLHYVLDEWFSEQIQPLLKGLSFIIRYVDDFVLGFSDKSDAQRVMEVLPKRFAKYDLTLHPEKTKLIDLDKPGGLSGRSFDFLGFTHYLGKSRKGMKVLKRKTSSRKFTKAVINIDNYIKENRHIKLKDLIVMLNLKLRGHYQYYGIIHNYDGIHRYYEEVRRKLYKWLRRRRGKTKWD